MHVLIVKKNEGNKGENEVKFKKLKKSVLDFFYKTDQ